MPGVAVVGTRRPPDTAAITEAIAATLVRHGVTVIGDGARGDSIHTAVLDRNGSRLPRWGAGWTWYPLKRGTSGTHSRTRSSGQ